MSSQAMTAYGAQALRNAVKEMVLSLTPVHRESEKVLSTQTSTLPAEPHLDGLFPLVTPAWKNLVEGHVEKWREDLYTSEIRYNLEEDDGFNFLETIVEAFERSEQVSRSISRMTQPWAIAMPERHAELCSISTEQWKFGFFQSPFLTDQMWKIIKNWAYGERRCQPRVETNFHPRRHMVAKVFGMLRSLDIADEIEGPYFDDMKKWARSCWTSPWTPHHHKDPIEFMAYLRSVVNRETNRNMHILPTDQLQKVADIIENVFLQAKASVLVNRWAVYVSL
ncbi:hypothetical protein VNI00_016087 [Paramarasmius palmivorus]|uniref:Uncharacterized protein n=1 Tax=Paramarasmius palmivorus TaxID=297713 RepID=A0AAW0BGB8_9AGAR